MPTKDRGRSLHLEFDKDIYKKVVEEAEKLGLKPTQYCKMKVITSLSA